MIILQSYAANTSKVHVTLKGHANLGALGNKLVCHLPKVKSEHTYGYVTGRQRGAMTRGLFQKVSYVESLGILAQILFSIPERELSNE